MPVPEDSSAESVYDQVSASRFAPYDPEAVQPTSPGPDPSSDAPGSGDTSGADGETGEQDQEDPLPEFDPRWREPFVGLIYLGALTDTFDLWGHEFVIRTLTTEEIAKVALLTQRYEGTLVKNAVYQAAVVAAAVVTVDGKPLPQGIEVGDDSLASTRFPYVMRKWMPPVREKVYQKYFGLEVTARSALEQMGNASG